MPYYNRHTTTTVLLRTTSTKVGVCLGDRIYMYCMVHYVICDYIKLRVDLRVHPQPCVT